MSGCAAKKDSNADKAVQLIIATNARCKASCRNLRPRLFKKSLKKLN